MRGCGPSKSCSQLRNATPHSHHNNRFWPAWLNSSTNATKSPRVHHVNLTTNKYTTPFLRRFPACPSGPPSWRKNISIDFNHRDFLHLRHWAFQRLYPPCSSHSLWQWHHHLLKSPGKFQQNSELPKKTKIQAGRYPPGNYCNISHLEKRNIIFKCDFLWDMLVPWKIIKFMSHIMLSIFATVSFD